jgi:pSer/pThr/pTyr-binding forkhead associated (FHA) protein
VFVVDITFQGDSSSVERIFVRRPYMTIGSDDSSHVVVTEMANLGFSIVIQRDLSRSFKVTTSSHSKRGAPAFIGGTYDGRASIDVGVVAFNITALDLDVIIRDNEPLDKAGLRILRRALANAVPEFPALIVTAPSRAALSFWPDQPLLVGRSRGAAVRLDVSTVSLQHARVGFESGQFWVEDLGSTNGTFVGDKQISGRTTVAPGTPIYVSRDACIIGVVSREQLAQINSPAVKSSAPKVSVEPLFPALVSLAAVARPSRVELKAGTRIDIGRDPSCGLWLGAPHISRRHCAIEVSKTGELRIIDSSTNGTAYDGGLLRKSESHETNGEPVVLDFGAGVTVALCFSAEHERQFQEAQGAPDAFKPQTGAKQQRATRQRVPRERRNTTWFKMDDSVLTDMREHEGRLAKFKALRSGLTVQGRVALVVISLGFLALIAVMAWMVLSGLGR